MRENLAFRSIRLTAFGLSVIPWTRHLINEKQIIIDASESTGILEVKHRNWFYFDTVTVWYDPRGSYRHIPCYSTTIFSFRRIHYKTGPSVGFNG